MAWKPAFPSGPLRGEDFLSHLEREPSVAIKIIMLLCQRIHWQSERMEESVLQPLPVRLARRLCALGNVRTESLRAFSAADMATVVGKMI